MNRFDEMEAFVRIVEAGSLTAAADQLDVAKSAVSRRLAELERRLGVQLLNRTTRRVTLTDAGAAYYQRAVDVLAAVDDAESTVREASSAVSGRIRLAAPLSFGIAHLGPALRDFVALHPAIELDIDLNDRQVDLVAEGFDLAIRIAQLADSQLAARRLTCVQHAVLASPAWWAEHGTPATPEELTRHQGLEYSNAPASGWAYRDVNGRKRAVQVPARLRASNGEFLRDAAIAGMGVIFQPTFITHQAIEAGQLVPTLTDYVWLRLDAWAVYPATRFLPQRVRTLVDFLAERFGDTPYWDDCLASR
ncbi:MAG: LysR family transcriptional regulator [Chromatiales bacterium]|nr:MAG: LysR family transcriptional regulator [Chromatiales bacterium]